MGFINSFSGGIFIGIGLFLVLPESKENLEKWSQTIETEFFKELPYCFFLTFLSYSMMLFFEKILFNSQSLIPMNYEENAHGHSHGFHELKDVDEPEVANSDEEEEIMKNVVSTKGKFASFLGIRNSILYFLRFSENVSARSCC